MSHILPLINSLFHIRHRAPFMNTHTFCLHQSSSMFRGGSAFVFLRCLLWLMAGPEALCKGRGASRRWWNECNEGKENKQNSAKDRIKWPSFAFINNYYHSLRNAFLEKGIYYEKRGRSGTRKRRRQIRALPSYVYEWQNARRSVSYNEFHGLFKHTHSCVKLNVAQRSSI